jgi:hypothetical protein
MLELCQNRNESLDSLLRLIVRKRRFLFNTKARSVARDENSI